MKISHLGLVISQSSWMIFSKSLEVFSNDKINIFQGNVRGVFVLWICGLMNQFLKDHQLNKAEFGVTDGSISV